MLAAGKEAKETQVLYGVYGVWFQVWLYAGITGKIWRAQDLFIPVSCMRMNGSLLRVWIGMHVDNSWNSTNMRFAILSAQLDSEFLHELMMSESVRMHYMFDWLRLSSSIGSPPSIPCGTIVHYSVARTSIHGTYSSSKRLRCAFDVLVFLFLLLLLLLLLLRWCCLMFGTYHV